MKFDWHLTVVRFVMAGISYYQISKPQNAIPLCAIEGGLFTPLRVTEFLRVGTCLRGKRVTSRDTQKYFI